MESMWTIRIIHSIILKPILISYKLGSHLLIFNDTRGDQYTAIDSSLYRKIQLRFACETTNYYM